MIDLAARAAAVRAVYNECFGCGLNNPIGLHLDGFSLDGSELTVTFSPRPDYCGFAGMLHGGIVASLLDETMAWTAMMIEGTYVVTANLQLRYRNPAPTTARYELRGRIVERRGRRLRIEARAEVEGAVIAEAAGLFLATEPVTD